MELKKTTVTDFTETLASKAATPGGGGASALAGALGAALGSMVGELTLGKPKYAAVEDKMQDLTDRAKALSRELLAMIDADAAAFKPLSRAYAIPKDDPGRAEELERCLHLAADAPMQILRLCCEAVELMEGFAEMGSALAISDAATGAALCRGALLGAAVNVKVNTKSMADRAHAASVNDQADRLADEYGQRAEKVFHDIYGRFC